MLSLGVRHTLCDSTLASAFALDLALGPGADLGPGPGPGFGPGPGPGFTRCAGFAACASVEAGGASGSRRGGVDDAAAPESKRSPPRCGSRGGRGSLRALRAPEVQVVDEAVPVVGPRRPRTSRAESAEHAEKRP